MTRNIAIMRMSTELLIAELGLPIDTVFMGASFDSDEQYINLTISHENLPESDECGLYPFVVSTFYRGDFTGWKECK